MIYNIHPDNLTTAVNTTGLTNIDENKLQAAAENSRFGINGYHQISNKNIFDNNDDYLFYYHYNQLLNTEKPLVPYLGETTIEIKALVSLIQNNPNKPFRIISEDYVISNSNSHLFELELNDIIQDITNNPISFEFIHQHLTNNTFSNLNKNVILNNLENYHSQNKSVCIPYHEIDSYIDNPEVDKYLDDNNKNQKHLILFLLNSITFNSSQSHNLYYLLTHTSDYLNQNLRSQNKDPSNLSTEDYSQTIEKFYSTNMGISPIINTIVGDSQPINNNNLFETIQKIMNIVIKTDLIDPRATLLNTNDKEIEKLNFEILYAIYPILPKKYKNMANSECYGLSPEINNLSLIAPTNLGCFIPSDIAEEILKSQSKVSLTSTIATSASLKYLNNIALLNNILQAKDIKDAASAVILHNVELTWQEKYKNSSSEFLKNFHNLDFTKPNVLKDVKEQLKAINSLYSRTLVYEQDYISQLIDMKENLIFSYLTKNLHDDLSSEFSKPEIQSLALQLHKHSPTALRLFESHFKNHYSTDNSDDIQFFTEIISRSHTNIRYIPKEFLLHEKIFPSIIENNINKKDNAEYILSTKLLEEPHISKGDLKYLIKSITDKDPEVYLIYNNPLLYFTLNDDEKSNPKVWKEFLHRVSNNIHYPKEDIKLSKQEINQFFFNDLHKFNQQKYFDFLLESSSEHAGLTYIKQFVYQNLNSLNSHIIMQPNNLIKLASLTHMDSNEVLTNVLEHHNPQFLNMLNNIITANTYNLTEIKDALLFVVEQYILEQASPPDKQSKKSKSHKF